MYSTTAIEFNSFAPVFLSDRQDWHIRAAELLSDISCYLFWQTAVASAAADNSKAELFRTCHPEVFEKFTLADCEKKADFYAQRATGKMCALNSEMANNGHSRFIRMLLSRDSKTARFNEKQVERLLSDFNAGYSEAYGMSLTEINWTQTRNLLKRGEIKTSSPQTELKAG